MLSTIWKPYKDFKIFASYINGGSINNPKGSFNCPSLSLFGYHSYKTICNAIDKKIKKDSINS